MNDATPNTTLPLEAPAAQTFALTPVERAAIALSSALYEPRLIAMAARSHAITVITNKAGYDEVHACRMVLKRERLRIEADGKAARDDAQSFSRAVIAEEKRLIGFLKSEEERLQALQEAEDKRVADDKEAKRKAEDKRVATITDKILAIKRWPSKMLRLDSAGMLKCINELKDVVSADAGGVWLAPYAEYGEEAKNAYESALEYMGETMEAKIAQEKDDAERRARLEEEREERRLEQEQQEMARAAELERQAEADRVRGEQRGHWTWLMGLINGERVATLSDRITELTELRITEEAYGDRFEAARIAREAGLVTLREKQREQQREAEEQETKRVAQLAAEEAQTAAAQKAEAEKQQRIDALVKETNAWMKADARLERFGQFAQIYRKAGVGLQLVEAYHDLIEIYRHALTPATAAKRSHKAKPKPSTPKEQA